MSTYTTGAKRGMGETIWLALITFVAASALVLALFAMQRGGSTSPTTSVRPAVIPPVVVNPGKGSTWIVPKTVVTSNGHVCARCAP